MIRPSYLNKGDKVAIVATAKKIELGQIDGAIREIKSWGLQVVIGPNLYAVDRQFAGTDDQRRQDLQWAMDEPDIKAVLFARGGYGTARILDDLNWSKFLKSPKWLCGFSDLTALHSHVNRHLQVETLHATMPIFFKDGVPNEGSESLRKALFGPESTLNWPADALNRTGSAEGELVGGNLSVLYSIMGTPSQMDFSGKLLFLEDLTENLYHIDRMIMQMKRAGHLAQLRGLIVGQFTEMTDNAVPFGKSAEEIILDAVSAYDYPVAFDAPIGHVEVNMAVFHGRKSGLIIDQISSGINY